MKTQRVSRRRFLALCGGGIAGIWLAGPTDGCVGDAGALFMRYGWRPASANGT